MGLPNQSFSQGEMGLMMKEGMLLCFTEPQLKTKKKVESKLSLDLVEIESGQSMAS